MQSVDPCEQRRVRELLRAGDHPAFVELYRAEVRAVFTLALRLTGSRSTAEDVASETFLIAWRQRGTIDPDDRPLRAWLLAITARQALNSNRSRERRAAFVARVGATDTVADFADDVARRLDNRALLDRTQEALRSLTRREAEVVVLCVWSDMSYDETAAALGVPVTTVRSRLARARTRLRRATENATQTGPDPRVSSARATRKPICMEEPT